VVSITHEWNLGETLIAPVVDGWYGVCAHEDDVAMRCVPEAYVIPRRFVLYLNWLRCEGKTSAPATTASVRRARAE